MYNGLADLRGKSRLDFRQCYPSSFFLFFILCVVPCLWWFFLLFYYAHMCVSVLVDVAMFILSFYCCRMCVCVCACLYACACADVLYPQYSCVIFFNLFFPFGFSSFLDFLLSLPFSFSVSIWYATHFSSLKRMSSKNVRAICYLQGSICSFIIYTKMERQLMSGEC